MLKYQLYTLDFFGGLLVLALVLRLWLAFARYEHRPLLMPLLVLTNWLVRPLARFIPALRGFELAALAAAFLVAFIHIALELWLREIDFLQQPALSLPAMAARAVLHVLGTAVRVCMAIVIIAAVASWMRLRDPIFSMVGSFASLLLYPLRRVMRPIGGLDLTPLVAIFVLLLASQAIGDATNALRNFL